jgi:hypothetical protein
MAKRHKKNTSRIDRQTQTIIDRYREFLEPTMSNDTTEALLLDETPHQTNAIRAMIAFSKKSEVMLLYRLQEAGILCPKGSSRKDGSRKEIRRLKAENKELRESHPRFAKVHDVEEYY